jgi:branched-chain amino acid aminotransferase
MFQKTDQVWMDGKLVPWDQANVHILTHSLHYGVGVFEGIRYYDCGAQGSAIFRLTEHTKRLLDSARIYALKPQFTLDQLMAAQKQVIKANKLKEGYLRPIAFISEGPGAGLWAYDNPTRIAIIAWGWGAYLGKEGLSHGARAAISSFPRHSRGVAMMQAKATGQYFNSVLAKREAKLAGFDEAIMLDEEGYVAEGTGENLFLVRNGVVKTPRLGSILHGITRDTIMTLLKDEGMTVVEDHLTRDDLYIADEVFMTGTAAEVTPIREVDFRAVGEGKPGPITTRLQKLYQDVVHGKVEKYRKWLAFVEG